MVDDRGHARIAYRIADRNALDAPFQLLQELVVDPLVNNRARARRTLLALEAESRLRYAFDGGVDVGVGIDDDRVLAAHLEHGALDPELAGCWLRCRLVDVQSNFARAGESDVANLGMRDQGIAEARAAARTED